LEISADTTHIKSSNQILRSVKPSNSEAAKKTKQQASESVRGHWQSLKMMMAKRI
jgi:hypothetical protein